MGLTGQKTLWQEAVLITSAKRDQEGWCSEGSLLPDIFFFSSLSLVLGTPQSRGFLCRCWPKGQSSVFCQHFFYFCCTYFIYFWLPAQYLTMTSVYSLFNTLFESSKVCSPGQQDGVLGTVNAGAFERCVVRFKLYFNSHSHCLREHVCIPELHKLNSTCTGWQLFQLRNYLASVKV